MKNLAILLPVLLFLSCTKDKGKIETILPELSEPFVNQSFGNCTSTFVIGSNPLTLLNSGDFVISGADSADYHMVWKLDPAGKVLWQKSYPGKSIQQSGLCFETSSGHLVALASAQHPAQQISYTKCLISKLDPANGDTIWTRHYGSGIGDRPLGGYESSDNNLWILEYSGGSIFTLIKVAQNGDSITAKKLSTVAEIEGAFLTTSDKKLVITSLEYDGIPGITLKRFNEGTVDLKVKFTVTTYSNAIANGICETADGGYVINGRCFNYPTGLSFGFLVKLNRHGEKIWERVIGSVVHSCVEKKPDEFYIGTGTGQSCKLYYYDLNNLTELPPTITISDHDLQLKRRGSRLYRTIYAQNSPSKMAVRLVGYEINK